MSCCGIAGHVVIPHPKITPERVSRRLTRDHLMTMRLSLQLRQLRTAATAPPLQSHAKARVKNGGTAVRLQLPRRKAAAWSGYQAGHCGASTGPRIAESSKARSVSSAARSLVALHRAKR